MSETVINLPVGSERQDGQESGLDRMSMGGDVPTPISSQDAGAGKPLCGIAVTRRILVFLAVLLVVFSVYEGYSNQPVSLPPILQQPFDAVHAAAMGHATSLSDTKDMFARRRAFGPPPPSEEEDDDKGDNSVRGWRAEVRENWELKGTSLPGGSGGNTQREAIVFDKRAKKMHFLQVGQDLRIVEQSVSVVRVDADRVELRSGEEVFVLE